MRKSKAKSSFQPKRQIGLSGRKRYVFVSSTKEMIQLTVQQYKEYTSRFGHGGKIGGNAFRIVDWTRSERASYAYDKKDPIDDEAIKALKSGLVLQIL